MLDLFLKLSRIQCCSKMCFPLCGDVDFRTLKNGCCGFKPVFFHYQPGFGAIVRTNELQLVPPFSQLSKLGSCCGIVSKPHLLHLFLYQPADEWDDSLFGGVLDCHAPMKTVRVKKNCAPWISRSIRKEMDKRNKQLRRFLGSRLPSAWNEYKCQRNLVVNLQRKAKIDYYHRLISKNTLPATLWNTLKSVCPLSNPSSNWDPLGSDHTSIANSLNDHFVSVSLSNVSLPPPTYSYSPSSSLSLSCMTSDQCKRFLASLKVSSAVGLDNIPSLPLKTSKSIISHPLSNIINSSISSSIFPSSWKCSSVRPIHKGGSQGCLTNYRPISILPVCSKVLEWHVKDKVTEHLDSNNLLYSCQSGFHSRH